MCGIVGLFLKDSNLQPELGSLLSTMLISMTERGPDSAGIAIYNSVKADEIKVKREEQIIDINTLSVSVTNTINVK